MTTHSAAAEQKAILAETDQPERKSVVDDFAGYRALRRRVDERRLEQARAFIEKSASNMRALLVDP